MGKGRNTSLLRRIGALMLLFVAASLLSLLRSVRQNLWPYGISARPFGLQAEPLYLEIEDSFT